MHRTTRTTPRLVSLVIAASFIGAACGGSTGPARPVCDPAARGTCIGSLSAGAVHLSMLAAQSQMPSGRSLFTFGLTTDQGGLLTGGSPQVWIGQSSRSRPAGPFKATYQRFTPDPQDRSPRSPLTGFYAAEVEVPTSGTWVFAAVADVNGTRHVATNPVRVSSPDAVPAAVGSKAISVATPVATTPAKLKEICTRQPPDHMHYISLDKALANGKPTVVTFATPLLCESMLCGPVVDEQLRAFEKVGRRAANFIHVEEFPPGPDNTPDTSTLPPYWKEWGFTTEPWTIVIDRDGVIRARFEGPVSAALIEQALQPLL
jgi:hypothetical protein